MLCRFITGSLLHFSKLGILEFKQALQSLHLILQVFQTGVQLIVLTSSAFKLFHCDGCASINAARKFAIATRRTAFAGFTASIVRNHQFKLIATCTGLLLRRRLWLLLSGCIHGALGRLKRLILLGDQASGLSSGATLNLVQGRDAQHFATLQAIDVITNEGVRIEILDCQHDLLHGNAIIRTHLRSDGPKRV